ncbi:hypothetical protein LWE61_15065 [Sphingobium sufflavum]|uniref:hypothetical protein n=1 Tax=Sphingobium sufflavum TaxID=1129547 RepID=UPI001F2537B9|nr:hypothetical protein [Sphingobium sufflavum]MCE7797871.1 hypothetical protein [Sphingobium sufflavum]
MNRRHALVRRLVADGRLSPDALPSTVDPKAQLRALGRLPVGEKNQTEQRYEDEVLRPRQLAGEIVWYRFEGIKLRLADNTFLEVDFPVMLADGTMELHDVKGSAAIIEEDAKVKMKVAASLYPFVFRIAIPKGRRGGGWTVEEVGPAKVAPHSGAS